MDTPKRRSVRIELTPEQQKQLRKETGQDVESLEVEVNELEPRVAPRSIGTFF
jgi:hypothetical protein